MHRKMMVLLSCSLMAASVASAGGAGPKPVVPATAACMSIADIVASNPQFSTLLTALQGAGLVETLKSGSYTVFAPTNDAFNKVPSDVLAGVLNDQATLKAVLLYHVVPGKVSAKQVMSLKSAKTAQGATISISTSGSKVLVNGVNVVKADVAACNGVIHIIDGVLIPPAAPAAAAPAAPAPLEVAATSAPDAAETPAAPPPMEVAATSAPDAATPDAATPDTAAPAAPAEPLVIPATPLSQPSGEVEDTGAMTEPAAADAATTEAAPADAATTDTAAAPADVASKTIAEIASGDPQFSTLVSLLTQAGLVETLSSGEFTVFAPTNDAFAKVDPAVLAALGADPELLKKVLLYHVVPGTLTADKVLASPTLTSAEGQDLTITSDGGAKINDAMITATDIKASNGVVHVIDSVLIPGDITLPEAAMTEAPAAMEVAATSSPDAEAAPADASTDATMADAAMSDNTIYDLVVADDRFSTLRSLLSDAGLTETLQGGEFTVFAPTDDAFAKLDPAVLAALGADPELLKQVLLYHVVPGTLTADKVVAATSLTSAEGQDLSITTDGGPMIDGAMITATDIKASNGVVHVIDSVLVPGDVTLPEPDAVMGDAATATTDATATTATVTTDSTGAVTGTTAAATQTITQIAAADPQFSILVSLLVKAGLAETLGGGTFTVFAPTNAAFDKLSKETLDSLSNNPDKLREVLTYHVIDGNVAISTAATSSDLKTLTTNKLPLQVRNEGGTYKIGEASVIKADIAASNGVIHVIDSVLIPPDLK
jgi:transforming growth factor-beta-induced protein